MTGCFQAERLDMWQNLHVNCDPGCLIPLLPARSTGRRPETTIDRREVFTLGRDAVRRSPGPDGSREPGKSFGS
jgi:hypothetical protein